MAFTTYLKIGVAILLVQVSLVWFLNSKLKVHHRQQHPPQPIFPDVGDIEDDLSDAAFRQGVSTWGHLLNTTSHAIRKQDTPKPHPLHKNMPSANDQQHPSPGSTRVLPQKQQRRSEDSRAGGEETMKKHQFYAHLLKKKEEAMLSPGCPDRGMADHVTSLAFVKVHKSASSTVANILARYALRHTLNVALPRKTPGIIRFNYFEPRITQNDVLPIPRNQSYQVVFNHMIFHRHDLEALMPRGTFYFAIMRHPLDRFVSSFFYYGFAKFIQNSFGLSSVKEALMFFMKRPRIMRDSMIPELYNSLAGDTGLHPQLHRNVRSIKAHIETLERDLDLIMVLEYFDESLILLKRMACLSMQDIVYLAKNVRSQDQRKDVSLSPAERTVFNEFQMADVLMYQHFYEKFWKLVYAEGPDFFLEVHQFKEIQRTVIDFCKSVRSKWDFATVPRSAWNEEFVVTARECRLMNMSELHMQLYLIDRAVKLHKLNPTVSSLNN